MEYKGYRTFSEYIKNNILTPSEEDYIEMIYRLSIIDENVKVRDISKSLNITPPSVTKMIKKLDKKDILNYKRYEAIELTEIGSLVGKRLLERHNTIYKFLHILGVKENIHEETEKIEHTISLEILEKINNLINFFDANIEVLNDFINYK